MSSFLFNTIGAYQFRDLNTIASKNNIQNHTRRPSIQSYPHYNGREEQSLNSIRYVVRQGDERYADVFPNKSHATNYYDYDGRRLYIQQSLKSNQEFNRPEVKTQYGLPVIGRY